MKLQALAIALACAFSVAISQPVQAGEWSNFEAADYGYTMLIPAGTQMQTKDWGGGWGGMFGKHEGVTIYGVAKKGVQEPLGDIEKLGVQLTGVPADAWQEVETQVDNGWTSYKTVYAQSGDIVVVGGYGVSSAGSYLILLQTTESDYHAHDAEYHAWYESAAFH